MSRGRRLMSQLIQRATSPFPPPFHQESSRLSMGWMIPDDIGWRRWTWLVHLWEIAILGELLFDIENCIFDLIYHIDDKKAECKVNEKSASQVDSYTPRYPPPIVILQTHAQPQEGRSRYIQGRPKKARVFVMVTDIQVWLEDAPNLG